MGIPFPVFYVTVQCIHSRTSANSVRYSYRMLVLAETSRTASVSPALRAECRRRGGGDGDCRLGPADEAPRQRPACAQEK
eukprot:4114087-Pleurochrysis_carterae.AAC.2